MTTTRIPEELASRRQPPGGAAPPRAALDTATPAGDLAGRLGVSPEGGLSRAQAERRLAEHGPNRLREAPRRPGWLKFLDQFRSFLIVVLICAAVIAGVVGDLKDSVVISVVLLVNATIGFLQEKRAERSLEALEQMLVTTARVRRDGEVAEIPADDLVPGDVVLLEAGDRIPADGRFLFARTVEVDESALTGESQPVPKSVAPLAAADVPLAERANAGT